jgi:hypothetical protein
MNAAAIASVHVGVIAWQQSRTTEQRTELHSGFIGLCLGAVAAFLILRAQHRAIDQCPWVKAKLSELECGCFSDQKRAEDILERLGITPHKGVG